MPPSERQHDAGVSVLTEKEAPSGWSFEVELPEAVGAAGGGAAGAARRRIVVTLAWVDYEYWSHGTASPSRVVQAVVESVLDASPERALPDRFDASTGRRWARDLDQRVRERL